MLVRLMGGLGNQMFIYAFARALANELKTLENDDIKVNFDTDEYMKNGGGFF